MTTSVTETCGIASEVAPSVASLSTQSKNDALAAMAQSLRDNASDLKAANEQDVEKAKADGISGALIDRLTLTDKRIASMADGLLAVAAQPDPVGEIVEGWRRPNGLLIEKVRVPLGVVAVIYEARPNVTADVTGLCMKAGNATLLRGSSTALKSNKAIVEVMSSAAGEAGVPSNAFQLIEDVSRESAVELMTAKGLVDLLVPRGGPALIQSIEANATVPVIIDGDGNCHVYVDASADLGMASEIVVNAKTQRPSVCNAAETLLVHQELADKWLPGALEDLAERDVEIRGDERVRQLWPKARPATEEDWGREYLDLVIAVRVVDTLDDAIAHVNKWGTSNSEAIVAQDIGSARRFAAEVDSGTVFVNASTRFSDGGEFGYGAEIGVSTQKLHARGPMGLRELTTTKYVVWGSGQIRT
ncbi:MAG: glutamate-5-semialdehyde dehydrogenase [Actinomycetota bacterium]|nr:glutamate-5-semialdehyde dehydrogenase [Actinomycetota bacterium]